ncbi:HAD family hydrolase [uncultured Robinsoniella sp.]|uniref:HAD family hydrolase n=1 Tax=uncultured Robinsoniella sp. TaxID=904190 RepID=UPI00374E86E9
MKRNIIIFTDSGDTIIDESSEKRRIDGVVQSAECIPGARETMHYLNEEGYPIVLVADGLEESFENVYRENAMDNLFLARAVSERAGAEKPAAVMFETAMKLAGLKAEDKKRIIMVGNNIKRDIAGAKRFGITSVLLTWSPRYPMVPQHEEEIPDYKIAESAELIELVHKLEAEYKAD